MRFYEFKPSILLESANPRTPHPEDAVFRGLAAAKDSVESMYYVIENPETLTIKWDGFPALIFGYNDQGVFTVSDKYMFDKGTEYLGTSPKFWQEYDASRGKNRGELYQKLNNIWNGLKSAVGSSKGFFWADLMWGEPLTSQNGKLVFKPNTVSYAVPANSDLGKQIEGTKGGVAVHQYFDQVGGQPTPWNSQGLQGNNEVAILTPNMGIEFKLSAPKNEVAKVNQALSQNNQLDDFLQGMDGVAKNALQKYLGHVATNQTTLPLEQWLPNNVSGKQYRFLVGEGDGYLVENSKQLDALKNLYFAIADLKNSLAEQLEQQVQGVEQTIGDKRGGEGFVFNTPNGLVKLVNRGGFSAAHFGKKK